MAKLAIKGHVTRVKEVIEILEMLGGKNAYNFIGACNVSEFAYSINEQGIIDLSIHYPNSYYTIFTLEEFLEKYPYKVGDKVKNARINDLIGRITNVRWDDNENQIIYVVEWNDVTKSTLTYFARGLQPYKEETMEGKTDTAKAINLIGEDYSGKRFVYKIPNGYEFDCLKNNEIILKPKQPQYPKTYVKCCDILNVDPYSKSAGYKSGLITAFRNLLICRDAYWKIAGEQMGLGKPWELDYLNPTNEIRYFIFCTGISIEKGQGLFSSNKILIFPTEEMRDAFYENFKELIELCKELL